MATKIVIDKGRFDSLFDTTLTKLKADRFIHGVHKEETARFENSPIGEMHRMFHYEICRLKQQLEKD